MSLTEKDFSGGEDSQDEDSGHDSTDSLKDVPVDDRERIVHLETAVAWIREEMVSRVYPMVVYSAITLYSVLCLLCYYTHCMSLFWQCYVYTECWYAYLLPILLVQYCC